MNEVLHVVYVYMLTNMLTRDITKDQSSHHFQLFKHRTVYPDLSWGKSPGMSSIAPYLALIQCSTKAIHLLLEELLEACSELQLLSELMENGGRQITDVQ